MVRFARIDHVVLQVPEIAATYARLLALGFEEAWPIGRTWPHGPTSGIALGGINLELLQPDEDLPAAPALAEVVFAPVVGVPLESYGRVVEKIESDPAKLAARGFPPALWGAPQRICTNAFPGADSPWPHFVCDYAPILARRLAAEQHPAPHGLVSAVEIGPLRARPRFVVSPEAPDLAGFLAASRIEAGAELCPGEDRVRFRSGVALDLAGLTIIGSDEDERSLS